jgi:hypothetical protein
VARRRLYLRPAGGLSFEPPPEEGEAEAATFGAYGSDPAQPVPYIPSSRIEMRDAHMVDDQRLASRHAPAHPNSVPLCART